MSNNESKTLTEAPKVDVNNAAILADIKNEAFFFAMKQVKGMANRKHAQFSSATVDYFTTHYDLVKKSEG